MIILDLAKICARPDVRFARNPISRFFNNNNEMVWQYTKSGLRQLKSTANLKLDYKKKYNKHCAPLTSLTNIINTTGYVFKLFDSCVTSGETKKQKFVAGYSTHIEYMARL